MCAETQTMTRGHARTAVSAVFALSGAMLGVWASRIPAIADAYDLSHAQLGLVLLCLASGAVLAFPFAGRAMDRHGAARITRVLLMSLLASLMIIPVMPNAGFLAIGLFVFGGNIGAMDVAMNGWGAEVERSFDASMMSSFHAMFSVGAGLGAATGYVAAGVSVLVHFACVAVALGLAVWAVTRGHWVADASKSDTAPLFALPRGLLALVGLMALCSALGEGAMLDWSAIFLRDSLAAPERVAALGFTVFSIAMVSVRLVADGLVTRFGAMFVARVSGVVATLGALVMVAAGSVPVAMVGLALLGAGYAVQFPLAFSRAANDPDVPPGRGLAAVATLGYGGILFGPPAIGFLAELFGLQSAFWLLVVLSVAIIWLASALRQ